jgi:cobalt-zinc-cadmium efflux system membrane fusion protein
MLPALLALPPEERRWKIHLTANPSFELPEGRITTLGSIDPNQHTALLIGSVPNPKDPRTEERPLVAGQFITATVQLPPPPHEVAIPTAALIDGGKESLVLVQPDLAEPRYEVRHVQVVRRTQEIVYLRWLSANFLTPGVGPAAAAAVQRNEVQPGERVVTSGSLLLLAKLQDLQAQKGD